MTNPDFTFEEKYWERGFSVIGIDEVGRGAFAGPVTVAGVSFNPLKIYKLKDLGINDSKKLTSKKREYLSQKIKELADFFHISFIDVTVINEIGIGKATFLGMKDVASKVTLKFKTPFLLIDAFEIPNEIIPQKGIIRGDSLSISIAAASIIAKVERDELMKSLASDYPLYGFDKHKGYGTKFHRNLIKSNGLSEQHRIEFCRKTITH